MLTQPFSSDAGVVHCPPCDLVVPEECLVWVLSFPSSLRKCALPVGFTLSVINDRIGFAVILCHLVFASVSFLFNLFLNCFLCFFFSNISK